MKINSSESIVSDILNTSPEALVNNLEIIPPAERQLAMKVFDHVARVVDRVRELTGAAIAPRISPEDLALLEHCHSLLGANRHTQTAADLMDLIDRVAPRPITLADLKPGDRFVFSGSKWDMLVYEDGNIASGNRIIPRAAFNPEAVVERISKEGSP